MCVCVVDFPVVQKSGKLVRFIIMAFIVIVFYYVSVLTGVKYVL